VKPARLKNRRKMRRDFWWLHGEVNNLGLFTRSSFDGVDEGRVDASMALVAVSA
jgi:hypothetical protein